MKKNMIVALLAVALIGGIYAAQNASSIDAKPAIEASAEKAETTPVDSTGSTDAAATNTEAPEAENAAAEKPAVAEDITAPTSSTATPSSNGKTVSPVLYGQDAAALTIEEYASFTCSHCASFYTDTLPSLQEKYLKSGKVKLNMHSFVRNEQDLRATMLVQCQNDNETRQKFVKVLMENQDDWAYSSDYLDNLRTLAKMGGVSGEAFDQCVNDKALETAIVENRQKIIDNVKVPSTPYFVIGKKDVKGADSLDAFVEAIESQLNTNPK